MAFPVADKEQEVGGFQLSAGHVDITEYFPRDAFLLASGVDRKLGGVTKPRNVATQDAHAEGVERRDMGLFLASLAEQFSDTLLHFGGGLVGERHGQNAVGWRPKIDKVRDTKRDNAGFSRARAGQDQQGSGRGFDRRSLIGIERLKQLGFHCGENVRCSWAVMVRALSHAGGHGVVGAWNVPGTLRLRQG